MSRLLDSILRLVPGPRRRAVEAAHAPATDTADHADATESPPTPALPVELRLKARGLADALERAIDQGRWEQAARLARSGERLAAEAPRLCERIARLRLAEGRPGEACALIERCAHRPASLRLLRLACMASLGQKPEAHRELLRWSRRSTAPLAARTMLALLEWEAGNVTAATTSLTQNLRHLEDPRTLAMLTLLATAEGRTAQATAWAERLHASVAFADDRKFGTALRVSIGLPIEMPPARPSDGQVDTLAIELMTAEHLVPSLVEAEVLRPDSARTELLTRAIEAARPELRDQGAACAALARLTTLAGDRVAARTWIELGLEAAPMSSAVREVLESARPDHAAETADAAAQGSSVLARIGTRTDARGKAA